LVATVGNRRIPRIETILLCGFSVQSSLRTGATGDTIRRAACAPASYASPMKRLKLAKEAARQR
jgi:hypothetical protein